MRRISREPTTKNIILRKYLLKGMFKKPLSSLIKFSWSKVESEGWEMKEKATTTKLPGSKRANKPTIMIHSQKDKQSETPSVSPIKRKSGAQIYKTNNLLKPWSLMRRRKEETSKINSLPMTIKTTLIKTVWK